MIVGMSEDLYKTIERVSEGIYKEKGSKFISFAYPVSCEKEIKEHVASLKKQYYDARHHCYAYMLGHERNNYRAVDDGEPSSTAGKPILGQILSNEITNILIVVVRYFGGTKLGVGGLITAYKAAAADAIDNNEIIEKTLDVYFQLEYDYILMNSVMKIIKDESLEIVSQDFNNLCTMQLKVRESSFEMIKAKVGKIGEVRLDLIKIA
jgi:uncharacterized YigZ family protein